MEQVITRYLIRNGGQPQEQDGLTLLNHVDVMLTNTHFPHTVPDDGLYKDCLLRVEYAPPSIKISARTKGLIVGTDWFVPTTFSLDGGWLTLMGRCVIIKLGPGTSEEEQLVW